jgi:hypothetical protein
MSAANLKPPTSIKVPAMKLPPGSIPRKLTEEEMAGTILGPTGKRFTGLPSQSILKKASVSALAEAVCGPLVPDTIEQVEEDFRRATAGAIKLTDHPTIRPPQPGDRFTATFVDEDGSLRVIPGVISVPTDGPIVIERVVSVETVLVDETEADELANAVAIWERMQTRRAFDAPKAFMRYALNNVEAAKQMADKAGPHPRLTDALVLLGMAEEQIQAWFADVSL